jgi:hypothetical protein
VRQSVLGLTAFRSAIRNIVGSLDLAAESLTMRDVDIVISQLGVSRVRCIAPNKRRLYCEAPYLHLLSSTINSQISKFGFIYALVLCAQKRASTLSRADLIKKLNDIFGTVLAAPERHLSRHSSVATKTCNPGPTLINTFHGERRDQVSRISRDV